MLNPRSGNVRPPRLWAVLVIQLVRLAVHAAALPVALDADLGVICPVDLIAPAPVRVTVEPIRHGGRVGGRSDCESSPSGHDDGRGGDCQPAPDSFGSQYDSLG